MNEQEKPASQTMLRNKEIPADEEISVSSIKTLASTFALSRNLLSGSFGSMNSSLHLRDRPWEQSLNIAGRTTYTHLLHVFILRSLPAYPQNCIH